MTTPTFTKEQLAHYKAYERVRASCRYNMLDPRARQAASLTQEEYAFVMENFDALQEQFEKERS
jgi:hypothetical protein